MSIGKDLLVVSVQVSPEVEDAWNRWYDGEHLPDIAACPGFVSAQRFVSHVDGKAKYLTVYEIAGASAMESIEFKARRGWGPFAAEVEFTTGHYRRIASIDR